MRTDVLCVLLGLALAGLAVGCEKGDAGPVAGDTAVTSDATGEASPEVAAPDVAADATPQACPLEAELSAYLPCTCFGKLVTDPNAEKPGCRSQVVCCPTCQGLRCEDHEIYDVKDDCVPPDAGQAEPVLEPAPEVVDEVAAEPQPEVTPPFDTVEETVVVGKCPYEVDLANVTLPCLCGDILVSSLAHAIPGCTKKVVCCPLGGLKCE